MARKRPIPTFDFERFSSTFRAETDRACGVLGAALIETRLGQLFARRLDDPEGKLLQHGAPFGTFSGRINVARALGWIDEDVRFDLDQVREIRNEFAHHVDHELSFEDNTISNRCRTLRVAQVLIDAHERMARTPHRNFSPEVIREIGSVFRPPRQRFEITVEMLAQHLDALPARPPSYDGPSVWDELAALGSKLSITVLASGTVG